ncbi:unnamed protein product [Arabis nemorensis]|uniref:RRM Nup35-type domain-containing protein n=1 Tax=Arabis nemorensis TaxID=586526 RepID=A0A565BWK7_9BRAS|nr:unnamed protein product [Arabis nemorensis]
MAPTPARTDEYNPSRMKDRASRQIFFVSGYDTWLPADCVPSALSTVFSSCGEIIYTSILPSSTFVCISGEGALEKALELSGSDVGGWTVVVKPEPTPNRNNQKEEDIIIGMPCLLCTMNDTDHFDYPRPW